MNIDQYIGRLLDNRYEILEVIGTGGMAVVYKARCHRLNRLVAIKILKDEFARDEEFRRRFHAEGEAVAMLSHPNIVQVYDVSSTDTANFIVMELIDGISLKQYMESRGVLNWKETLHFAMQIAKGLEHAHSRGIVHRDIKPHNVMVLKNGSVKVMDFGIARVMNKSNTLTKEALGSVHYISPEQAKGGHTDNRSDIYSLGVVMYEMMTGRPPYDGESAVAVAIQHINGGAAMPSTLNPNIPGGMEQIIMKAMALEIQNRYVSATEMLQDMEEFRKNPAILFNYKTIVDDATRPITGIPPIPPQKPRTTAEKVVQAKTGVPPQPQQPRTRVSTDSAQLRRPANTAPSGTGPVRRQATGPMPRTTGNVNRTRDTDTIRRAQARKRAEEQRREEQRSRIATISIVVCSAVAVVALIVFLYALFNGALLNKEREYVEVPYLVGKTYSDDMINEYKDLKIVFRDQQYNDSYEEGQIMMQEPIGGSKVVKGTELWITISMGEEPEVKTMSDLIGTRKEEADSHLRGQGFYPIFRYEASSVYEEGEVIRTDPAFTTELKEGQDVYLWISTGPDTKYADMQDVMGMDIEAAKRVLAAAGFNVVRTRPVPGDEPAGQVVYQSVKAFEEIDVLTEILLEYSEGPKETTAPTTEATEATTEATKAPETTAPEETEPEMATVNVDFILPDLAEDFLLSIKQNGRAVIESTEIKAGTTVYTVTLTNSGTKSYDIYINGDHYNSQEVKFTDD
ncbi:MAG: Stk1 family PASTA domain-containing Ser/Thr kinase [Oscillospiraceae bacterium]|nr:Stk1 family PASTA domain-containing Ser/Thr kinase [Oscillospiraceae bacterium]